MPLSAGSQSVMGARIPAPSALSAANVDGLNYLVLGSAGSNSLSVMHIGTDGALTITDHLLDDRKSRFGGVADIAVVTVEGHTYVIAGGSDDGISVFQLLPGGQLLARAHIADETQMGLANVSSITATADGTAITIFVGSSAEIGITQLRFEIGLTGSTLTATPDTRYLLGTGGVDMLIGDASHNILNGAAGDDIIFDGTGRDRLTGGAGADTFILTYDQEFDSIEDFDPMVDRLDLSAWPGLRSMSQLTLVPFDGGIKVAYGGDIVVLRSADGTTITPDMLNAELLFSGTRLPQTLVTGFSGPAVTPDLPEQPDVPTTPPDVTTPIEGVTLNGSAWRMC